jgi:hypothetical protein
MIIVMDYPNSVVGRETVYLIYYFVLVVYRWCHCVIIDFHAGLCMSVYCVIHICMLLVFLNFFLFPMSRAGTVVIY